MLGLALDYILIHSLTDVVDDHVAVNRAKSFIVGKFPGGSIIDEDAQLEAVCWAMYSFTPHASWQQPTDQVNTSC